MDISTLGQANLLLEKCDASHQMHAKAFQQYRLQRFFWEAPVLGLLGGGLISSWRYSGGLRVHFICSSLAFGYYMVTVDHRFDLREKWSAHRLLSRTYGSAAAQILEFKQSNNTQKLMTAQDLYESATRYEKFKFESRQEELDLEIQLRTQTM